MNAKALILFHYDYAPYERERAVCISPDNRTLEEFVEFHMKLPNHLHKLQGPLVSSLHDRLALRARKASHFWIRNIPVILPEGLTTPEETTEKLPVTVFNLGQVVEKKSGSEWRGRVVGYYSTELTPIGYAVESDTHKGSVQIYPEAALRAVGGGCTNTIEGTLRCRGLNNE